MSLDDLPAVRAVIDANGLFPSEMLNGMATDYFDNAASNDHWLTAHADGAPVGVAYYVPERMTQGTWNLLLIAVHPDRHGHGIGSALMRHIETALEARGERILLVETSSLPEFTHTRKFYHHIGYHEEARIRDFYQAGEDKIVFRKVLQQPDA